MLSLKKIYLIVFLTIFCQSSVYAEVKIAYFDLNYVIDKSNVGLKILKKLDSLNNSNLKILNQKKEEINKGNIEIDKIRNVISEEELKVKINEQKERIKEYNELKVSLSNEINNIKNKEVQEVIKKIKPFLEAYTKENSIDIILRKESIYLSKNRYDITKEILEIVNKRLK